MTLRFRNRLNLLLFFISLLLFIFNIFLLIISIHNGTFTQNDYLGTFNYGPHLLKYIPLCPIISLLYRDFYAIIFTIVLYRSFVKTQATDIVYFALFIISFLVDSFRIWIPLLNLQNTYSQLYMFCGNAGLFAIILAPVSLLFTVQMGFTEQRQGLEKNIAVLFLLSFFLAGLFPLNTAKTLNNFMVENNFQKLIFCYSIIAYAVSIILQFFNNKSRLFSQKTTIGLALLEFGTYFLVYSENIVKLSIGIIFTLVGTSLFIKTLHNQYLWLD